MSAWQPIETAPLDQRFLAALVVRNNKTGKRWWEMHVVWIDDEDYQIHADSDAGWSNIDDYTHWMPLPAPPELLK